MPNMTPLPLRGSSKSQRTIAWTQLLAGVIGGALVVLMAPQARLVAPLPTTSVDAPAVVHPPAVVVSRAVSPPRRRLGAVDIDIGTNGRPLDAVADRTLITFDPGDELLVTPHLERYPHVISDVDGDVDFTINEDFPQCSSLNRRNEHYSVEFYDEKIRSGCNATYKTWLKSISKRCLHPQKTRTVTVRSRRLSSFLREKAIVDVNVLKIDAQGHDSMIVKDLLENYPQVRIKKLILECQDYDNTVPLYMTANDCGDIETYLTRKLKKVKFTRQVNNCLVAEYNLFAVPSYEDA